MKKRRLAIELICVIALMSVTTLFSSCHLAAKASSSGNTSGNGIGDTTIDSEGSEGDATNINTSSPEIAGFAVSSNLKALSDNELRQIADDIGISESDIRRFLSEHSGSEEIPIADLVSWAALEKVEIDGALPGLFTIDATGKQVRFSKGNLSFKPSSSKYQFEKNQYDFNKNLKDSDSDYGAYIDTKYNSGVRSTNGVFYWNDVFADGNKFNVMDNSEWVCLTYDEFDYLWRGRSNASEKWGYLTIEAKEPRESGFSYDISGIVFLPDQYTAPSGCDFAPRKTNKCSTLVWSLMEANGAVFIPFVIENSRTTPYYWFPEKSFENKEKTLRYFHDTMYLELDKACASIRLAIVEENNSNAHQHSYSNEWLFDSTNHWHKANCEHATEIADRNSHSFGSAGICTVCGYDKNEKANALPGRFSISADKKVQFSTGNLYWNGNKYSFERNQYDYRMRSGQACVIDGSDGTTSTNDVGTFFWTSSPDVAHNDTNTDTSRNADDVFFANNASVIGDGWFCFSHDEWNYLINEREGAKKKRAGVQITTNNGNKISGYCILPDDWVLPIGCVFYSYDWNNSGYYGSDYTYQNHYDENSWKKMESAGAVFLPVRKNAISCYRTSSLSDIGAHWMYASQQEPGGSWYVSLGPEDSDHDVNFYESCVDCSEKHLVRLAIKN